MKPVIARCGRLLAVLVAPLAFVIICRALERDRGPLWLGTNSDPSYQYLFSAMLLAHGMPPQHVDHPGTTSQLLGAAVFMAAAPGVEIEAQTTAVLGEPERMLGKIVGVHWAFAAAALAIVGGCVLAVTRSLASAVAVQLMPLLQVGSYRAELFFAPEALLLPLAVLLAGLLLVRQYAARDQPFGVIDVALGIIAAAGVVTKITFAPLCALPLLVQQTWRRALGVLVVMWVAGAGFLWPIRGELPRMLTWFANLATHQGVYGSGSRGFVDWAQYPENVARMGFADRWLGFVIVTSLAVGGLLWRRKTDDRVRGWVRLLVACASVQLLGVLLVAKHPHHAHYLLPLAASAACNVGAILELARHVPRRRAATIGAAVAIAAAVVVAGLDVRRYAHTLRATAAAQLDMKRQADAMPARRVDYYRSSSPEFALFFGDSSARHFFGRSLEALYPGRVFYNLFDHRFETYRFRLAPDTLPQRAPLVLHGDRNIEEETLPGGLVAVPVADNGVSRILRLEFPEAHASGVRSP